MADNKVVLGNRDAKIMRENEGKTPYELLQLGLSKAAYERLLNDKAAPAKDLAEAFAALDIPEGESESATPKQVPAALTPDVVEQVDRKGKKPAAQPRLGRTADQLAASKAGSGQVKLLGPTGIPQLMSEKQALKMVARNPNLYKIV